MNDEILIIQERFCYFSGIYICSISYSFDPIFVHELYYTITTYHTHPFCTTFFLRRHEVIFSRDNIIMILSLPNVHDSSFPIILFKFENLLRSEFQAEFHNISSCNIIEMFDLLVGPNHRYDIGAFRMSLSTL